jgi:hypothetical protein
MLEMSHGVRIFQPSNFRVAGFFRQVSRLSDLAIDAMSAATGLISHSAVA